MQAGGKNILAWSLLGLMLLGLPLIATVLASAQNETTDMRQWLPDSGNQRELYDWFVGHFGYDDVVLVSWVGCTLDDDRLQTFKSALLGRDSAGYIRRVVTGPELVERLMQPPTQLSEGDAIRRLQGIVVGPALVHSTTENESSRLTCAIVDATEFGIANPQAVMKLVKRAATDDCGINPDTLRLGGGIYQAVHIDEESQRSFLACIWMSGLIGCVVSYASLRSVRLTLTVVICAAYCSALSLALVQLAGFQLNALMLVLPALIYVLVISSAMHLMNYFRDVLRDSVETENSAAETIRIGWMPCVLASVTTSIGMVSLATSRIVHVRSFGLISAVGLLVALVVLLGFLFATMQLWLRKIDRVQRTAVGDSRSRKAVDWCSHIVIQHHFAFMVISCIIVGFMAIGLARTTSSVKLERMFRDNDVLIESYRWLEENMGPLAAIEIIVEFDPRCELKAVERLRIIYDIQTLVGRLPEIGGTSSATTFLPDVPISSSMRATIRRATLNKKLEEAMPRLFADGLVSRTQTIDSRPSTTTSDPTQSTEPTEYWRITARITALDEIDYERMGDALDGCVETVLEDYVPHRDRMAYRRAGSVLVMNETQQQILDDLTRSFLLAFTIICPLMIVLLRGFVPGMLIMIPNCIPGILVFGGMGWLGIPMDIGTILTASVALGIAVDDTLHFLTWFQRGMRDGQDRLTAIRSAYKRCAIAMIQTTLICGLGLLAFAGSSFVPTSRFAVLMFVLLFAALFGDLIFLPAMLAGWFGKWFEAKPRSSRTHPADR